jgi:tetratricopeptide (TPR) repeat protein
MIPILFVAAAAASIPSSSADQSRFAACVAAVETNPQKAIDEATSWQVVGGGILARQCLGLAFAAQSRWLPAMTAFEQAATEADRMRDGRAARLWVQAGNAALAATDAAKARGYFDVALVSGQLMGAEKGEAHLDRARALVALRQVSQARTDLDEAIKLVPEDPLAWLLSATLARRSGDMDRASTDIAEAIKRAADDPQVALEAGNIALMQGSETAARTAWTGAVKLAPQSAAGMAAAEALEQLDAK